MKATARGRPVAILTKTWPKLSETFVLGEILEVNEEIARMIGTMKGDAEVERKARDDGMTTMIEDGVAKCRAGITTVEEILRVVASR